MSKKLILTIIILLLSALTAFQFVGVDHVDDEQPLIETPIESLEAVSTRTEDKEVETLDMSENDIANVDITGVSSEEGFVFDLYYKALQLKTEAELGKPHKLIELIDVLFKCEPFLKPLEVVPDLPEHPNTIELRDWWYSRCAGFQGDSFEDEFGTIESLTEIAAERSVAEAKLIKMLKTDSFERTQDNLQLFRDTINSQSALSMQIVGSFSEDEIMNKAWTLLSCDYGFDCTENSKEFWKFGVYASCTISVSDEMESCNSDYQTMLKHMSKDDTFNLVLEKKTKLQILINSGNINSLEWEDILGNP